MSFKSYDDILYFDKFTFFWAEQDIFQHRNPGKLV